MPLSKDTKPFKQVFKPYSIDIDKNINTNVIDNCYAQL